MDSLIHADIFFFVTTIAVIVAVIVLGVVAFYVIKILRDVVSVMKIVKAETEAVQNDVESARRYIKTKGVRLSTWIETIVAFFLARRSLKKRRRSRKK